jgi:type I restriction enzyme R subunit
MNAAAVHDRFTAFVQTHPNLASHQIKFLDLLQNHIATYGSFEVERLYEPPFTLLHCDSIDGVFSEPIAEELLSVLRSFEGGES